jgi:hypothetical protein
LKEKIMSVTHTKYEVSQAFATGGSGDNKQILPDNLADALSFTIINGGNALLTFVTTNSAEALKIAPVAGQKIGFFGAAPVVQQAALTAAKTNLTIADAEGTPDNSIAAITNSSPFGFSNAAEAITVLYKVQNLVTRVGEIEAALENLGLVIAN